MEMKDVRIKNLRRMVEQFDSVADFCRHYDVDPSHISQMFTGRRPCGEKAARTLELKLGIKEFSLDEMPGKIKADRASQLADNLIGKATPRSRKALLRIQKAAENGRLSEKDIQLLEQIAERLLHGKSD